MTTPALGAPIVVLTAAVPPGLVGELARDALGALERARPRAATLRSSLDTARQQLPGRIDRVHEVINAELLKEQAQDAAIKQLTNALQDTAKEIQCTVLNNTMAPVERVQFAQFMADPRRQPRLSLSYDTRIRWPTVAGTPSDNDAGGTFDDATADGTFDSAIADGASGRAPGVGSPEQWGSYARPVRQWAIDDLGGRAAVKDLGRPVELDGGSVTPALMYYLPYCTTSQ